MLYVKYRMAGDAHPASGPVRKPIISRQGCFVRDVNCERVFDDFVTSSRGTGLGHLLGARRTGGGGHSHLKTTSFVLLFVRKQLILLT